MKRLKYHYMVSYCINFFCT